MKGYAPSSNGTLYSDTERWFMNTFLPNNVPRRYGYLKGRIYNKIFGPRGALHIISNFVFSLPYEEVSNVEVEDVKMRIELILETLK